MALQTRSTPRIPVGISGHRTEGRRCGSRLPPAIPVGSPGDRRDLTGRRTPPSIPRQRVHPSVEVVGAPAHRTTLLPAKPQRRGKLVPRLTRRRIVDLDRPVLSTTCAILRILFSFIVPAISVTSIKTLVRCILEVNARQAQRFIVSSCFGSLLSRTEAMRFVVTSVTAHAALCKSSRRGSNQV